MRSHPWVVWKKQLQSTSQLIVNKTLQCRYRRRAQYPLYVGSVYSPVLNECVETTMCYMKVSLFHALKKFHSLKAFIELRMQNIYDEKSFDGKLCSRHAISWQPYTLWIWPIYVGLYWWKFAKKRLYTHWDSLYRYIDQTDHCERDSATGQAVACFEHLPLEPLLYTAEKLPVNL